MEEVIWVTNISTYKTATVNPLWACLLDGRHPCPTKIYLIYNVTVKNVLEQASRDISILLDVFGCKNSKIEPFESYDDPEGYDQRFSELITEIGKIIESGKKISRIYFDVTAGRKFMAMTIVAHLLDLISGKETKITKILREVDEIYLVMLYLLDYKAWYGRNSYYLEIPLASQKLKVNKVWPRGEANV